MQQNDYKSIFEGFVKTNVRFIQEYPKNKIKQPKEHMMNLVPDNFQQQRCGVKFQPCESVVCGFLKYFKRL